MRSCSGDSQRALDKQSCAAACLAADLALTWDSDQSSVGLLCLPACA